MAFYSKYHQSEHYVDNIQQETNNEAILCDQEAAQSQHSRRSSLEFFDTIDIGFELFKTNDEETAEDDLPLVERNFKRSVISGDETVETQEVSYEARHDVTDSSNILVCLDTPDDHPRLVGSGNDDHQDQCIMRRFINGTSRSHKTIASAKVQELALETLMSILGPDFDLLRVGLECQLKSLKGKGEIEFLQTIRHDTCSDNHSSSKRLIYVQLKEECCEYEGKNSCLFSFLFGFSSFCGYCTTSVKGFVL